MNDYHDETSDVIKASRSTDDTGTIKSSWPPDWVEGVALLMAIPGGLVLFSGIFVLLGDRASFSKNIANSEGLTLFVASGLMFAEGIGLNCGKTWAVSVPLILCLSATFALGIGIVSNVIPVVPRAMILLSVLAVADLFFMLAQRALSKHRRSLR